jgi:ClpP class serine protease
MKLARIVQRVTSTPWLITPAGFAAVKQVLDSKLAGANLAGGSIKEYGDDEDADYLIDRNGIAQIMVSGVLGQRLSWLEKTCGGADYLDIESATNEAIEEGARGILYQFDSPGGMSTGCPETAAVIAGVEIPKVGFSDSMMCSAAYYLGSGCDYLVATESAEVGSIGVIIPWVDSTRAWEMAGLKADPIVSDGDTLKSSFYGPTLTSEQRAHFQQAVDDLGAMFRGHVSEYRNLDFDTLKAGAYGGARALDLNLVDKLGGYADAYAKLLRLVDKAQNSK